MLAFKLVIISNLSYLLSPDPFFKSFFVFEIDLLEFPSPFYFNHVSKVFSDGSL